ncbi:MAG: hypothetical protein EX272_00590 [Chromatiales bacterium]|nr:MAG: hypothetical protein EX272_00590 [Chromatiales bacterium]
MTTVASAPGKIVLSGEYAVLSGAPAICMAVQRRAIVTITDSPGAEGAITTPGYAGVDATAIIDTVGTKWRQARNVELDTRAFSEQGNKIGLGSSAALVVALLAALENSSDVFAAALEAHRRFQGGAGSGVDVAAAVHGGLIEYEMQSANVRSLGWPEGLAMRVLWTGVAASTSAKLDKLAATRERPSRAALGESAEHMAKAWRRRNAEDILAGYAAYIDVLRQFSLDHDLGIFDAGHDELTDAALVENLVYKPAGAGGGDIGVLFGLDPAALDTFIEEHRHLIHDVVACELDPAGVRLESA